MKTLLLDYEHGYEPADYATFGSDTSCFGYDLVIWDPRASGYNYASYSEYRGLRRLSNSDSVRAVADIGRRRTEFREFVDSGKTLVILVRPPQGFYYDTGNRTHSGTGKNRQTTTLLAVDDFLRSSPLDIAFTPAAGNKIQFVGTSDYTEIWATFRDCYRYEAVISGNAVKPLFKISGTDKVVGGLVVASNGNGGTVVLLPAVRFMEPNDELDGDGDPETAEGSGGDAVPVALEFQTALVEVAKRLQHGADGEPLPEWALDVRLDGERAALEMIRRKELEIERARGELSALQGDFDVFEQRKRLVTDSGRPLELQVKTVLEALGGEVTEPDQGRDDWQVSFPEGPAVVEVKGRKKSAAEKDSAQLEKWVSSYYSEHGVLPKGLLVVNGWRSLPIANRVEAVFPDQMLNYAKSREHCLATGVQFLGILQEIEARPERAEFWRKRIFSTKGVLRGMSDAAKILDYSGDVDLDTASDGGDEIQG